MGVGEEPDADPGAGVAASVDRSGSEPRIVIEERGTETAWLSALQAATCSLREWR